MDADHAILLGRRGVPDAVIAEWLGAEPVLFLTHDEDFTQRSLAGAGMVLLSRVSQSLPLKRRIETWLNAVSRMLSEGGRAKVYELFDDGSLVPWHRVPRQPEPE